MTKVADYRNDSTGIAGASPRAFAMTIIGFITTCVRGGTG